MFLIPKISMFFGKKANTKCESCSSKVENKFSFCPYCGNTLANEKEAKEYGLLGKNDSINHSSSEGENFGITDKIIGSLMNTLVKSLDKQFRELEKTNKTEVQTFPNGIKIQIGQQVKPAVPKRKITEEQLTRMSHLARTSAKTSVKRLSDKIIYELNAPGISSPQDIFVSKLESGYEIKAIGDKVYTNTLPISLPLKTLSLDKNKILIEFKIE